jgi:hypothetical protein
MRIAITGAAGHRRLKKPDRRFSAGLMESISEADLPLRKGVVCPIPDIYRVII